MNDAAGWCLGVVRFGPGCPMNMTETNDYLDAALRAMHAGISVLPPRQDGSKRPLSAWKRHQSILADEVTIRDWYANGRTGVGVVPGAVSGGLELFEFDEPSIAQAYIAAADRAGLGDLVERIIAGYCELTPGGGVHWFWRCAEVGKNTKLARRPEPTEENPLGVKVLIETRGEGGFAIVAPSDGRVHPSGGAYRQVAGGWESVATITPDERRAIFDLARSFDAMPRRSTPEHFDSTDRVATGDRPGDVFAARTDWTAILEPAGWRFVFERDGVAYWRRPGKAWGISASTNFGGSDLFYVFSTSTIFETEQSYTKFGAYAALNHGGDYGAAGRALAQSPGVIISGRADEPRIDPETGEIQRHYEIIDAPDYVNRPPPVWRVPRIIPEGAFFSIYGPPASYKSFWGLDLLASIASDTEFHGFPVVSGPCLYIAAEGASGLMLRLRAWERARDVPLPRDLKILPGVVALMNAEAITKLIADIRSFETPFAVVLFDTFSRSIAGADENQQKDMTIAVDGIGRIQRELGTVVGMVHHGTKGTGSLRGSGVLDGALDTIIRITASGEAVTVHNEKQKDGLNFEDMVFRRVIVSLSPPPDPDTPFVVSGGDLSSVVLERMQPAEERAQSANRRTAELTPAQRTTLQALDTFSPAGATRREWLDAARVLSNGDLSRQLFRAHVDALHRRGFVKVVTERNGEPVYVVDGRYRTGED